MGLSGLVAVVLAMALLGGCAEIKVLPVDALTKTEPRRAAVADVEKAPQHDLAVISLDLDPPPRLLQMGQTPNVALLVAVDNKGRVAEQQVAVVAMLRSRPDGELLAQRREVIPSLAPGQATIVRFAGFPSVPMRSGYELIVTVEPVPGERNLANNTMVMPLQLILNR